MVDRKAGILRPESAQFDGNTDDLKGKLKALRKSTVLGLVFINVLWLALILPIGNLNDLLGISYLKDGPISALFFVTYFVIIIIQFGALFIHRIETLLHVMARNNLPQKVRGHWFNPNATIIVEIDQHTPKQSKFSPAPSPLQSAATSFGDQQYSQEEPAPLGNQLQSQASEETPSREDNTVEPASNDNQPQGHRISREEGRELSPSQTETTSQPQQPIPDPPLPHSSDAGGLRRLRVASKVPQTLN